MAHSKTFRSDNSGVAIIEFALILPVLLLIVLGTVEYGTYFMRQQVVQRTMTTTASSIQLDPSDTTLQTEAYGTGAGLVNYQANGNYICARAYATSADAKSGLCSAGNWLITAADAQVPAGTAYYVALVSYVQQSSLTGMFHSLIPAIRVTSVFKVGGRSAANNAAWLAPSSPTLSPNDYCVSQGYLAASGGCRVRNRSYSPNSNYFSGNIQFFYGAIIGPYQHRQGLQTMCIVDDNNDSFAQPLNAVQAGGAEILCIK